MFCSFHSVFHSCLLDGDCIGVVFFILFIVFFFKQKTAYEMRISDWSSDVCSSDLGHGRVPKIEATRTGGKDFATRGKTRGDAGGTTTTMTTNDMKIGRASCRERVCQYV